MLNTYFLTCKFVKQIKLKKLWLTSQNAVAMTVVLRPLAIVIPRLLECINLFLLGYQLKTVSANTIGILTPTRNENRINNDRAVTNH